MFNPVVSVCSGLFRETGHFFGGDEADISRMLALPEGTLPLVLGVSGFGLLSYLFFRVIPPAFRLSFLSGGLAGSAGGFILWMNIIGPGLLP